MKDNEIISLFELRDEHAIEALSDKYHPYCYKIAWNLLTNKEDSEECLNDTWFSVWSLIPPKKPSVLSHFCGRITRNLSIDRLRKKYANRRPDVHMTDVLGEMDQLSVTYTIEDQLAEKELLEIINAFLGKMNAEDRDIFVKVIFPATTPFILTAVRLGISVALTTLIAAETTGATAGLGMRIRSLANSFETAGMLMYIIIIGIIGLVMEKIIKFLEGRLTGWQEKRE